MPYDIVVVGGGPGGSAAAWAASSSGARVLQIDKARFPRDKPCGDGVTPRGVKLLTEMGLEASLHRFHRVDTIRVSAAGRSLEQSIPQRSGLPNYMYVVPRTELDELIVRRAQESGVELWEETSAVCPLVYDGNVRGVRVRRGTREFDIEAPLVIAADGAQGKMGRLAGLRPQEEGLIAVALRAQLASDRADSSTIEISCLPCRGGILPGYGWVFPMGGGEINVGIGYGSTFKGWKSVNSHEVFERFLESLPESWNLPSADAVRRSGAIKGWRLPMGLSVWPPWRPGLVAVGDAAGVVKPTTGAGISKAIESGLIAGEVGVKALGSAQGPSDMSEYARRLEERWGRHYRRAVTFTKLTGRPRAIWTVATAAMWLDPVRRFLKRAILRG